MEKIVRNLFLKFFIHAIRPFIPRNLSQERILIVATTALGDTLWATPAIENIRRTFPNAYIAVLTSPIGLEVLQHNPHIDRLYLLKNPFSLWRKLYSEKFDTVLFFHASQRVAYPICSLLGATRIIGTAGINKGLDTLFTHILPNQNQHELVRRLQIAEQIGTRTITEQLSFFLQPEESVPKQTHVPCIAIHPGSKDNFKRWPAENFAKLGCLLKERLECQILVTGNASETVVMEQVAAQIPGAQILKTGSIRNFAAHLNNIDLLISNDTGPVHLASALGRPVIALYSATDPQLCGPHHAKNTLALFKRPTCTPCLKRKCRSPFCFLQFSPTEVCEAALKKLIDTPF